MNLKNNTNILKLSLFIILFFTIFFLLLKIGNGYVLDKKIPSRWYAYKQLPENSIDVLFMGNSRSFCSIDPRIVDDLLGTNSFVLGISAESIITTYYELKEALKTQSPSYVVLESFVLNQDPKRNKPYFKEFIWNVSNPMEYDLYIRKITKFESDSLLSLPLIQEHNILWKEPFSNFIDYTDTSQILYEENLYSKTNGFLPRESIINLSNNIVSKKEVAQNPYEQNIFYFQKFIELCKKNGIELLITTSPTLNNSWLNDSDTEIHYFDRKLIEQNTNFLFSPDDADYSNYFLFTDGQHLSTLGAIKFSINFSEFFSKHIRQGINQNLYEKYTKLLIENIQLKLKDNKSLYFEIQTQGTPYEVYLYIIRDDDSIEITGLDQNLSVVINDYSSIKYIDMRLGVDKDTEIRVTIPIEIE